MKENIDMLKILRYCKQA